MTMRTLTTYTTTGNAKEVKSFHRLHKCDEELHRIPLQDAQQSINQLHKLCKRNIYLKMTHTEQFFHTNQHVLRQPGEYILA